MRDKDKDKRNCGVGTSMLYQAGIRIQRMVYNIVCPRCKNKIDGAKHTYYDKSIWHKTCYEEEIKSSGA